ncbi:hypothetical protein BJ322DRAFT_339518 [Thelephora terrestris]|uniref:Uncharacterized protein n=1 Tax=Thelephora terrestris TaxID=56493 RepID=A0A9P6H5N8_9AGAM|nr:hypothetical protein BJ322DRAFT_339518 [Thelephora terrestris]
MATVKLSITLIIVIAVSGLVGCIVFLFLIFRCCRRPESAPLPPIQPLAHHREKEANHLSHPRTFRNSLGPGQLGIYESDTSLLKPSGKSSSQTDGSDGTPSSSNYSLSNPSSPQTNVTGQQSVVDEQASVTQQYVSTTRQARSVSRGPRRPRSRVVSVASTNTIFTQASPRPTSIIRGAPHSAHSSVRIVLPSPLAPQLHNNTVPIPSFTSQRSDSDQDLSNQESCRCRGRKSSLSSGHQCRRSLGAVDQERQSESQAQLIGRTPSDRSTPPESHNNADTAPPVPPMDDKPQLSEVPSQDCHDGKAG